MKLHFDEDFLPRALPSTFDSLRQLAWVWCGRQTAQPGLLLEIIEASPNLTMLSIDTALED